MMEIFPHSTLVAQVSDPYTPEISPPPGFIVSIVSRFQVVIFYFFFGMIFFNSI